LLLEKSIARLFEGFYRLMKPYRILYIHSFGKVTGASKSLLDLIRHLNKSRYQPIIALPHGNEIKNEFEESGAKVISIRQIGLRKGFRNILLFVLYFIPTVFSLYKLIKRENIQLVHINSCTYMHGAIAAWMRNVPCVYHIREFHGFYPEYVLKIFLTFVALFSHKIIVVADIIGRLFSSYPDKVRKKVITIYNGVDTAIIHPDLIHGEGIRREFSIDEKTYLITHISEISFRKGQMITVRAFSEIKKNLPNSKLLLVGGWKNQQNKKDYNYFNELKTQIKILQLEKQIILAGHRNDIPQIMAASDIIVHPSMAEAFSRINIEAMAMKKPIVTSWVGGSPEAVVDGITGFLVSPMDPGSVVEAVLKLLDQRKRLHEMGEAARERAVKMFDIEINVKKTEAVYESLLSKK
jgi:glycosyltransferase involved in cell wall biosynthesis